MATYDEIIDYCYKYRESCKRPDGSMSFEGFIDIESLGINFSRLSREEARGLAVGLSYTLICGNMSSVRMTDHTRYWDAVGKHLLDSPSLYFGESSQDLSSMSYELYYLKKLFITVIKTETSEWEMYQSQVITRWNCPSSNQGDRVYNAVNPGEYFVYPLLEAIIKRLLIDYVGPDGVVRQNFEIMFKNRKSKAYKKGDIVSQISHLLILLTQKSEDKTLIEELHQIFSIIEDVYSGKSAIEVISDKWRNSALHGERHTPTASGVVLNLILLLSISSITEKDWEKRYEY
ncbi:TPA: hypothetical protein ACVU31_002522 [Vibrio parahaemolyticus]